MRSKLKTQALFGCNFYMSNEMKSLLGTIALLEEKGEEKRQLLATSQENYFCRLEGSLMMTLSIFRRSSQSFLKRMLLKKM